MGVRIHNFESFNKIYESNGGVNLIIGDSCTPIILKRSKSLDILGNVGSERTLWKSGMGVKWLKEAVSKYPVNTNIKNVVINIGTNGAFSPKDDIRGLVAEVRRVFPSAKLFVVQGSWGWGYNKNVTSDKVKTYYDRFKSEGVNVIEPPIGNVKDPHTNLPVYTEIGAAIDQAIASGGTQRITPGTTTSGTNQITQSQPSQVAGAIISRTGDPYKYKVENDHWLAKRDNQSRWYEITGADFKAPYQVSIDILDTENPNLRSKDAPKRSGATNQTSSTTPVPVTSSTIDTNKLPIKLSGSYKVPKNAPFKADALHSFDRRKLDGFGGYMFMGGPIPSKWASVVKLDQGKGVNQVLSELIGAGIKPDVKDLKIKVNDDYSVNWEATIDKSTDGKAYAGVSTRGSAGGNADKRALDQIDKMKAKKPNAYNWKQILDLNIEQPIKIRQYFFKYSDRDILPELTQDKQ
jgi:hypothetical protein